MNAPSPAPLLTIGGSAVTRSDEGHICFTAGLQVDADGAPHGYHHDSSRALDYLANAGAPGKWWGIATDKPKGRGNPYVQGPNDPAPGFFVSTTALEDLRFRPSDPRRYVNSEAVPFIVIPGDRFERFGVHLGDKVIVTHLENEKSVEAIVADIGPAGKLGEGSIALAKALGVNPDPKRGGTERRIVRYVIFPGVKSKIWPV